MNDNRDKGPQNLDRLHASMLGYVEQKKKGHKFTPGVKANIPDKYCTICGAVFGSAPPEAPLKAYICGMCNGKLADGQTAVVCGSRYAFIVNSKSLEDMKGKVIKVSSETMDAMNQLHSDQVKTKANGVDGVKASNAEVSQDAGRKE